MGVIRRLITVTPSLPNAGAYIANDQVGGSNELANAAADTGGTVEIESVVVIDKAKQSLAMDLFFFDKEPTLVSSDNDEFEMTDANLAAQCKGLIKILSTDYSASKNASVGQVKDQRLFLKAQPKTKSLYMVVVTRGTPTYADGDLVINVGIKQGTSR